MADNKVKISNILGSLIPDFVETDNALPGEESLFKQFLNQYYAFEEHQYGPTDLASKIADIKDISTLSEIETVRTQTIPVPGTGVPTSPVVLAADVYALDDVIYVNQTTGFPDTYGLLKIDDEIITYTGKTATSFTGCVRGFSGISAIESAGDPEFLTFSETQANEHSALTGVGNLGFIFLVQFYEKFKTQFLPGVEKRSFALGLSVENILTRARDFYTSKGTDTSLDILFKVLFGKPVTINKPFDDTITSSDADWQVSDEIMVEALEGDPMNLKFSTLFQGLPTNPSASGAISNVEEVFLNRKTYHRVFLSRETINIIPPGKFYVSNGTQVTTRTPSSTVVTVDSTVGFGATGFFWYPDSSGTYQKVEYTSKSYNQFFGCVGLTTSLPQKTEVVSDDFVYGYEDNNTSKLCKMRIVGSIANVSDGYDATKFLTPGDKIKVKYLGERTEKTNNRFNTWFHNDVIEYDILGSQVITGNIVSGIDVASKTITTVNAHSIKATNGAKIDIFEKQSGALLDSNVSVMSVTEKTIVYNGNGPNGDLQNNNNPVPGTEYVVRNVLKLTSPQLGLDHLSADIQNSFISSDEDCAITFSGFPAGDYWTDDRSRAFLSDDVGVVGAGITIFGHNFLNGEKVYYQPLYWNPITGAATNTQGIIGPNGSVGIDTGTYYVEVVDGNTIKLASSKQSLYTGDTLWNLTPQSTSVVGFPTGIGQDLHNLIPYNLYYNGELRNQNNFKRIRKIPKKASNNKDIVGPIGVTVNGLELHSPLSDDSIFYGQINSIDVSNGGEDYDVISPPNVSIADSTGSSANAIAHISDGYLSEIVVTSPGWDYKDVPAVTLSGGNSKDVDCEAKMKWIGHSVAFNDLAVDVQVHDENWGRIAFTSDHRFLNGEEVIYTVSDPGTAVGVGSTNVGLSTNFLVNGGRYYIIKNDNTNISLALTKERAIAGINTIKFTNDGAGTHTLTSTRKRRVVDKVIVKNAGSGFGNNRVEIDSYVYPHPTNIGILTSFTGVNLADNYIYGRNHNFKDGDLVTYSNNGTAISGLSTLSQYKVKVVDKDKFKLSDAGTADKNLAPSFEFRRSDRLTSHTYVDGATSWQQVDNASTANGYVGIWLRNLRVGSKYRISLRVDNNPALDGGSYNHRIHPLNNNPARTNFNDWDGASAGLLTAEFIATTENDDEFLFYTNASTVNITNFEVKLVSAVEDYDKNIYVNLNSIGVGTHTFNYPEVSVSIEGISAVGVGSDVIPSYYNATGFARVLGKVDNIFVKRGGGSYGCSDILNHHRQPSINLDTGEDADVGVVVDTEGSISAAYVTKSGKKYTSPPMINVIGIGTTAGRFAELKANISNGEITSVDVINGGNSYSQDNVRVTITPVGKEAKFMAYINEWKFNNVERYHHILNIPSFNDTVQVPSNKRARGNKLCGFYVPKILRTDLKDNLTATGQEKTVDLNHSPIIGWAYDGNPIYGPYGNVNAIPTATGGGGGIMRLQSSYILNPISDATLRPDIGGTYWPGYFINDWFYEKNSGELDENNGRMIVNDDFPNGTYAYFSSLSGGTNPVPSYPYLPFRHYNETDNFNYDLSIEQSDNIINTGEFKRNTTDYGFNNPDTNYTFLSNQLASNPELKIDATKVAGITTVTPVDPGKDYQVGDLLTFSKSDSVSGSIRELKGKNITSIALTEKSVNDLEFSVVDGTVTAFSTLPHGYIDSDIIQISGISSSVYKFIEGPRVIGVNTVVSSVSVALGATSSTGVTTFISLTEPTTTERFRIGDVIKAGNEQMLILAKDYFNNRYRVARSHNATSATAHSAGVSVEKLSQEFTYPVKKEIKNRNLEVSKKYYFDGELAVGVGTTAQYQSGANVVGYVGINSFYQTVPAKHIFLPNHKFVTGEELSYVAVGSTIKYSLTTDLSQEEDLKELTKMYCVKFSDNFIGIATQKSGISTSLVGLGSTAIYFKTVTGHDHRFESVVENVTGNSKRVAAVVGLDTSHGMLLNDTIKLNIKPTLTQDFKLKYNDTLKKLVVDPITFAPSAVSIGSSVSTITITKHGYETGDLVFYEEGTAAVGGLSNNTTYYVVKLSDDLIRLAANEFSVNQDPYEYITLSSAGTGDQTLSRIHPPLKVYRGNTVAIGASDPSLDLYDLDFYYDKEFKSKYESSLITKTGTFGDGNVGTQVTLNIGDDFPTELYYEIKGLGIKYTNTYPSSTNIDVPNYSKITVVESELNKSHRLSGIGVSDFDITLVGSAETTSYTPTGFSTAYYTTDSTTEKGGIHSINVVNTLDIGGLSKVVSVGSTIGSDAIFTEDTSDIGQILAVSVVNQGLEFTTDKTLPPKAEVYTVLKLKDVFTLESIGIATGGRNYTTPPKVVAIGNSDITTRSYVEGSALREVEIISNDSGLSKNLKFVPTVNTNGVGIINATSSNNLNKLFLRAPINGYQVAFPFAKGDLIFVENVSIVGGAQSTSSGYNSEDYDYEYFTVTDIDNTGGVESITYSIAGIGSTGGLYDSNNPFGRVIKKDNLAVLDPIFAKVKFFEGEKITQEDGAASGYVVKNGWDPEAQTLKLRAVDGTFKSDQKITSSLRNSKSVIETVYDFNVDLEVSGTVAKATNWNSDKGKLNFNNQRLHDNDYYQRFSYSIKGEVPYATWKEPVSSLGHVSGYKPFSNFEILNGDGIKVGMATNAVDLILKLEISSLASVHERFYYDMANEQTDNPNLSKIITFDSKILTDYSESRTNKVLLLSDISNQFTGKTKTFTGDHRYKSSTSNAISIVGGATLNPITGSPNHKTAYNPSTGVLTVAVDTVKFTPSTATYNAATGLLELTIGVGHGLTTTDYIKVAPNSLKFKCEMDGKTAIKSYPRIGIDTTAYENFIGITTYSASTIGVNVGTSATVTHNVTDAVFTPSTGIMTCTIGSHSLIPGTSIRFKPESLTFQCEKDNYATDHSYPRSTDPAWNTAVNIEAVTGTTITVGIGSTFISDQSIHRWKPGYTGTAAVISGGNYPHEFSSADTDCIVTDHGLTNGTNITITDYSMTFTCTEDNHATDHTYPRPSDPASTSNTKLNSGILPIFNATGNTFDVTINTPVIGGQTIGLSTFALYTIDSPNVEPKAGVSTERLFYKTVPSVSTAGPGIGISVNVPNNSLSNTIHIDSHEFSTQESLEYSSNGGTRIGISSDPSSGINTTFLPPLVYAIKVDKNKFKLAASASNALAGTALTITSIGTGNTHTFAVPEELAATRALITIDNMIQSPLTSNMDVSVGLQTAVGIGTTTIFLADAKKIVGNSLLKIEGEVLKVTVVGAASTPGDAGVSLGSTQSLSVIRGAMGTVAAAHTVGAAVTVVTGDYRIKEGNIHFAEPPYGPAGIGSLTTRSSFAGRSYYRLKYDQNTVFDDVSENFDGQTSKFMLKRNGTEVVGIETNYGMVLINGIWQDPHHGSKGSIESTSDYSIVGSGSSIDFNGTAANKTLPKGGIINEFDVSTGVGLQSSFTATTVGSGLTSLVVVSAAGTITSVGIGTSGSGYLFPPKVGIAITNYHFAHQFVSASPNCVTSAGSTTYTPTHAVYESTTGNLTLTIPGHGIGTNDTVGIANNTMVFKCSRDGFIAQKTYPRASDPVSGIQTAITNATTDTLTINVGRGAGIGASFTSTINNGMVTGITVTNPGTGYTSSFQPIVEIDPPSPWVHMPLTGGTGVGASIDVVVGTGGSVISFSLSNPGRAYSVGDVLTMKPVPYKVGVTTSPFQITVKNRHQDKFAGWAFGQLLELDDFSSLFNGYRKSFLITRTDVAKEYFSIIAQDDSGIVLANNLLIFINDVLQKPGGKDPITLQEYGDYFFTGGTRITFREAPRKGSKIRMYLYVASRDDYFEVDIDPTIKPGDGLRLQYWDEPTQNPPLVSTWPSQGQRMVYELISSDSLETQTYSGVGIRTDDYKRPIWWRKQTSDTVIDGVEISKSRNSWELKVTPNTNIIASVAATDTKIYVKNTYPTFWEYDDISTSLNNIRIVGYGSSDLDTTKIEEIKAVTYTGDYGHIAGIAATTITNSGVSTEQLEFEFRTEKSTWGDNPRPGIQTGDYFVVENTNVQAPAGFTALGINTSTTVSVGTTWIDGVYQCYHYNEVGLGNSSRKVIANVKSLAGVNTTTIPALNANGRSAGTYSWGTINVTRSATSDSFTFFNQNGIAGIETSAHISRIVGLKVNI